AADMEMHATSPAQQAGLEFDDFRRAFAKLPAEQREALVLVGADGFKYEEAAAICGCAVGTIKSRGSPARRDLQVVLGAAPPEASCGASPGAWGGGGAEVKPEEGKPEREEKRGGEDCPGPTARRNDRAAKPAEPFPPSPDHHHSPAAPARAGGAAHG